MRGLHEWTAIMARAERIPTVCDSDGQTQILTHFAGLQILTLPNLLNYWNSPCSLYTRLSRWRWRAPTVREKRVRPSWLLFWGATNSMFMRESTLDLTWPYMGTNLGGVRLINVAFVTLLTLAFVTVISSYFCYVTWVNNLKAQLFFQ